MTENRNSFRLDRRIPVALVFAFVLQTGGALFWAGSAAQRIGEVERQVQVNSSAVERVVRLEEQVSAMHEQLARIELKIDQLSEPDRRRGSHHAYPADGLIRENHDHRKPRSDRRRVERPPCQNRGAYAG